MLTKDVHTEDVRSRSGVKLQTARNKLSDVFTALKFMYFNNKSTARDTWIWQVVLTGLRWVNLRAGYPAWKNWAYRQG